ncbi:MAG: hypothetical protein ACP5C4_07475 [Methanomicrobiales archaeon]
MAATVGELRKELDKKTTEVYNLTKELEATNEGLIALYMELDDSNKKLAETNKKLKEQEKKLITYLFETVNKTRNPVATISRNVKIIEDMLVSGDLDADEVKLLLDVIKTNARVINENIVELNKIAIEGSDRVLDSYREFLTGA